MDTCPILYSWTYVLRFCGHLSTVNLGQNKYYLCNKSQNCAIAHK